QARRRGAAPPPGPGEQGAQLGRGADDDPAAVADAQAPRPHGPPAAGYRLLGCPQALRRPGGRANPARVQGELQRGKLEGVPAGAVDHDAGELAAGPPRREQLPPPPPRPPPPPPDPPPPPPPGPPPPHDPPAIAPAAPR